MVQANFVTRHVANQATESVVEDYRYLVNKEKVKKMKDKYLDSDNEIEKELSTDDDEAGRVISDARKGGSKKRSKKDKKAEKKERYKTTF